MTKLKNISEIISDTTKQKTVIFNITVAVQINSLIDGSITDDITRAVDNLRGVGSAEVTDLKMTTKTFDKVSVDISKKAIMQI